MFRILSTILLVLSQAAYANRKMSATFFPAVGNQALLTITNISSLPQPIKITVTGCGVGLSIPPTSRAQNPNLGCTGAVCNMTSEYVIAAGSMGSWELQMDANGKSTLGNSSTRPCAWVAVLLEIEVFADKGALIAYTVNGAWGGALINGGRPF